MLSMSQGALQAGKPVVPPVSPVYIAKYNRYVDNVLNRINKILRTKYDPVSVKIQPHNTPGKKTKKRNQKKRPAQRRRSSKDMKLDGNATMEEPTLIRIEQPMVASVAAVSEQLTNQPQSDKLIMAQVTTNNVAVPEQKTEVKSADSRATPNNNANPNPNKNKTKKKKNQKKKDTKKKRNAKATLYGLSSIIRDGDVVVNLKNSHTMVQTNFIVGPLTLRVEKEFGRGAKKNVRSATATTTDMRGKLNLKVVHGGSATLQSIRVLQPKQVRVDSADDDDDHDRTREFVWRRSSHIAHLVGQKLTHATRSMLKPVPEPPAQMSIIDSITATMG